MPDSLTYYSREVITAVLTLLVSSTGWLFVFYLTSPSKEDIINHQDVVSIISKSSPYDSRERAILDSRFKQLSDEIGRTLRIIEVYQDKDESRSVRLEAEVISLRVEVGQLAAIMGKKKE